MKNIDFFVEAMKYTFDKDKDIALRGYVMLYRQTLTGEPLNKMGIAGVLKSVGITAAVDVDRGGSNRQAEAYHITISGKTFTWSEGNINKGLRLVAEDTLKKRFKLTDADLKYIRTPK